MLPESGRIKPLASFISTDLPPPAGPRMMRVSPRRTVNEMSSRTGFRSNAIETFSKTTTGSPAASGLCCDASRETRFWAIGSPSPAEDADHGAADEKIDDDDEDGGD